MSPVTLDGPSLQVTVNPQVGGTITHVLHKSTGLSVLGTVPWGTVDFPLARPAARDEPEWLTRYTGGWPLLFPNAGDACFVEGTFHGFHGEASIATWNAEEHDGALVLARTFTTLPAIMRRRITVEGEVLRVCEELTAIGSRPVDVMWGHHPTFGSDLLAAPFEVTCGAHHVEAEVTYDPPSNPIVPGASGTWPLLGAKTGGSVDLAHPRDSWASVAYLKNFGAPWAAIRRMDDAIAVQLSWDGGRFPCAWLWYELTGTLDAPWNGRTRLVAIEPNTTPCALGLSEALARGAALLHLAPGTSLSASIALRVFKPSGPILNALNLPHSQGTTLS